MTVQKQFTLCNSCLITLFEIIEASTYILFEKGFMKSIADITLANIDDQTLCQDSSTLIYNVFLSNIFIFENYLIPPEIMNFKLPLSLLKEHNLNDMICFNMIHVLNTILPNSKILNISEDDLGFFYNSGIFEIISSILKRSTNENLLGLCAGLLNLSMKGILNSLISIYISL